MNEIDKSAVSMLRDLARVYTECALDGHNEERKRLHRAVNDNRMIRPVVLIDELPWSEMELDKELTLVCQDSFLRSVEQYMRQTIYRFKYVRGDMIVRPYLPVRKVICSTGYGVNILEDTVATQRENEIISHQYKDQFEDDKDLDKLHKATISYDKKETFRRFNLLGELVGDILPIRAVGKDYVSINPWDKIAEFRGVDNLLMDLIAEPEKSHELMRRLTEIYMDIDDQYLSLGLFDTDPDSLHCTSILNSQLHPEKDNRTFQNIWGRATAQIFASVSKGMHEEFDIEYMKKAAGRCGLVYYGCCEPLDKKIDIVEKIPNLRKISITPWADIDNAAEVIGNRYVIAAKPNPAFLSIGFDEEAIKKEITDILAACKKNGSSFDLVLKDISTVGHNPYNVFKWEKMVMDIVNNY